MLNSISILCFFLMVVSLGALGLLRGLISFNPLLIAVQVLAIGLMIWARVAFGHRSFHASANPTDGGLVTSGPYGFIRHPIYTAACLFTLAGVLGHLTILNLALLSLVILGAIGRLECEERLLVEDYPDYREYIKKTKRMIPGVY